MANLLITGAGGRLGRGLIELLSKNNEDRLTFLSISELQVEEISKVKFPFRLREFDALLHLSWPASSFAGNYRSTLENLKARDKTIELGRLCMEEDTWFIGMGSVLDDEAFAGSSLYAETKREAKNALFSLMDGANFTWMRPFWVFEPPFWPSFLFPVEGQTPKIEDDRPRDFIHVDDVATAISAILEKQLKGSIDIGSSLGRSPSSILGAIGQPYELLQEAASEVPRVFPLANIESLKRAGWYPYQTGRFFGGHRPDL